MRNNIEFKEKYGPWVLITGASSGVGYCFAEQLAQKGLNLILVARREEKLNALASKLEKENQIQTKVIAVDLTQEHFMKILEPHTKDLEIGLLVNNAGFGTVETFLNCPLSQELDMLYVNCRAPLILAHTYGQQMLSRGRGGMIFLSSIAAFMSIPQMSHYAATKSYDLLLGEGLNHELKKQGIDVLTVCPGETNTEFQDIANAKKLIPMEPDKVVTIALNKLGRRVSIVTGILNSSTIRMIKPVPRKWVSKVAGWAVWKAKKAV